MNALLERARVLTNVRIDQPDGVPYSIEHPGGDVVVLALFDHRRAFWPTLFGAGDGNLIGVSDGDQSDILLDAIARSPPNVERCKGDRLELFEVDAPSLAPSGRTRQRLCVRLPASYATSPKRRYPAVYLLPGLASTDTAYLAGKKHLGPVADALATRGLEEVILVGVDTSTRHGSSYFTDSPATGNWKSFVPKLLDEVDARYRTRPNAASRGVMGHSTGGFNAVSLALSFPERFGAVAASAPDALDLESWLLDESWHVRDRWLAWARLEDAVGGMGQLVSYAVAWSPDPSRATGFRFPFDLESGVLNDDWKQWRKHSPVAWLDDPSRTVAIRRALSGGIFLTVGKNDEFGLREPTERFAARLRSAGIDHELVVTQGGHFSDSLGGLHASLDHVLRRLSEQR